MVGLVWNGACEARAWCTPLASYSFRAARFAPRVGWRSCVLFPRVGASDSALGVTPARADVLGG